MIEIQFFWPDFLNQAIKSLCDIWYSQDIPNKFMMSLHATRTGVPSSEHIPSLINKPPSTKSHDQNTQLPSLISPSTQLSPTSPPFMSTHATQQPNHCIDSSQTNVVLIKGFVHKVLHQLHTSGSVLQMTLCYLEAICSKVPDLVQKEKMGVQGELDLSDKIVQGDLD